MTSAEKNNDNNLKTMCGDTFHQSVTLHGSTHLECEAHP